MSKDKKVVLWLAVLSLLLLLTPYGCTKSEDRFKAQIKEHVGEMFTTYQTAVSVGNSWLACSYAQKMVAEAVRTNDAGFAQQYQQYVVTSCGG